MIRIIYKSINLTRFLFVQIIVKVKSSVHCLIFIILAHFLPPHWPFCPSSISLSIFQDFAVAASNALPLKIIEVGIDYTLILTGFAFFLDPL